MFTRHFCFRTKFPFVSGDSGVSTTSNLRTETSLSTGLRSVGSGHATASRSDGKSINGSGSSRSSSSSSKGMSTSGMGARGNGSGELSGLSTGSAHSFDSWGGGTGNARSYIVDPRQIAQSLKARIADGCGTLDLSGDDLGILDILAEWPHPLILSADTCDPSDIVAILRDDLDDLCSLSGSVSLWSHVGSLVFSTPDTTGSGSHGSGGTSTSNGEGSLTSGTGSDSDRSWNRSGAPFSTGIATCVCQQEDVSVLCKDAWDAVLYAQSSCGILGSPSLFARAS
jgi:hypothetical protein